MSAPVSVPVAVAPRRPRGAVAAAVARLVCWPLAAVCLLASGGARLVEWGGRALLWRRDPGAGEPEGRRRFLGAARQGARYLAWRSRRFPPLSGRVNPETDSPGPWEEVRHRLARNRVAMASLTGMVLYLYVAVGAAAGWIAPDPMRDDREAVYVTPTFTLWPLRLGEHPLGTDFFGRDVAKLTVHGTTTALLIGTVAGLIACLLGLLLGALAGYFGRFVDDAIVWLYATIESIPYLLLMLTFGFLFKKNEAFRDWWAEGFLGGTAGVSVGLFTIVFAVGLTYWVGVCRLVRGEFIRLRERDYVTAARALGVPTRRIIFRHVTPNVLHVVLISFSLLFMAAIKSEVILSFLGVGLDEGEEVSWGRMISQAKLELLRADPVWWQITSATVAMFGLLLCVNLFTDALRDALDPRLRS